MDIENLAAFYLGRAVRDGVVVDEPVLVPSKHLVTHAVCVGMTGSGKTGLCTALLEEAAIDGIPALIVDPKGDLANLALSFPDLPAASFAEWLDEGQAAAQGTTTADHAAEFANIWRSGVVKTLQTVERVRRYHDAAEVAVYTPGSTAGRPLAFLSSLSPPPELVDEPELLAERVLASARSLLALAGVDVDDDTDRRVIFIAQILTHAALAGERLEVADVLRRIVRPPFATIGILDVDTYFPESDRTALMVQLNSVLASPAFALLARGEPLDIQRLLYGDDGKPRLVVLSIAHLNDAQRMAFVSLLLTEVLAWVRRQPGTQALRALMFFDEIAGFMPPVREPPSKRPLLTLMKQARAFGFGVVVATQNPVDLDYKALSNCGLWMLGRLQTEQDRERVLSGLSLTGDAKRDVNAALAGLQKRQFLVHNVHQPGPLVLESRHTLSFLRGPMTRTELARLKNRSTTSASPASSASSALSPPSPPSALSAPGQASVAATSAGTRPVLPADLEERFVQTAPPGPVEARLVATAKVRTTDRKHDVDHWRTLTISAPVLASSPFFGDSVLLAAPPVLTADAPADLAFQAVPSLSDVDVKNMPKDAARAVVESHPLVLRACAGLKLVASPSESEAAFNARVDAARREARDDLVEKAKTGLHKKVERLEKKLETAQHKLQDAQAKVSAADVDTALSVGSGILGALFGRKTLSSRTVRSVASSAKKANSSVQRRAAVTRAEDALAKLKDEVVALDEAFTAEVASLEAALAEKTTVETIELRAKASGVTVEGVRLVWFPRGA